MSAAVRSLIAWVRRRPGPAGTLAAAVCAAAVTQTWFVPGRFVATGDVGPMLRGLQGVTRSWTHSLAGSGSTGHASASLPDALVHDIVTGAGLSATVAQRLWYTLLMAGAAAAVAWMAAAWCRHATAVGCAGAVVALAPFHFVTLPNPLPLVAMTAVAAVVGWAARSVQGRPPRPPVAVVLGLLLAPLAKNPPLLVVVVGVIGAAATAVLVGGRALRPLAARATHLAGSVGWLAAASAAWVVPLSLHHLSGTPGLEMVAQTDVGAWDWTHRNSGPANVVRLWASWVWGEPDAVGSLAGMATGAWSVLAFGLPLAVGAGVVLATRRRLAAWTVAGLLVLVVLSAGLNPPVAAVNRLLYAHVPGFWLFRQPMSKFGVLLVVGYAAVIALGVDGLLTRRRSWPVSARRAVGAGAVALAVAVVAVGHPMWTGSVLQGERGGATRLPPERVAVPASWVRAGGWLDDAPRPGSVAVLPLSPFYQQGTSWGYYGVNDLVGRVSRRPALNLLPGGYYEPAGSVPELLGALQAALAAADGRAVVRLMDALGVAYVAVRTDLTTMPTLPTADGAELLRAAARSPLLRVAAVFDHVTVLETVEPARRATRRVLPVPADLPDDRLADVVAVSPDDVALIRSDAVAAGTGPATATATAWLPTGGATGSVASVGAGTTMVTTRSRAPLIWEVTTTPPGPDGARTLGLRLRSTLHVDGEDLVPAAPTDVAVDGDPVAIEVDGRVVPLAADGPTLLAAEPGEPVGVLVAGAGGDVTEAAPASGELGNCNDLRRDGLGGSGISAAATPRGLELRASADSACFAAAVPATPELDGARLWSVRGEFARLAGGSTRVCLWLPAASRCASGTPPAFDDRAGRFEFVAAAHADEDVTGARLVLYAEHRAGVDGPPVTTRFRDVRVAAVHRSSAGLTVPTALRAPLRLERHTDGEARLSADRELTADLLGPVPDRVEDCNDYDDAPATDNGLSLRREGTGPDAVIELSARRHSACITVPVEVPPGVRHVTLDLEYRTTGPGARWCLRNGGSPCVERESLRPADRWQRRTVDLVLPDHDRVRTPGAVRLHLYADGAGAGTPPGAPRTVRYRRVSVRPTYPLVGVVVPDPATATHVAVARTAFAAGWTPDPAVAAVAGRHVVVDGWANGWEVPPGTDAPPRPRFGPDRLVALAVWSLPVVLVAAVTASARGRRRTRMHWEHRPPGRAVTS
jgi:arabinofuranan 3-O-arabinosyltransferase